MLTLQSQLNGYWYSMGIVNSICTFLPAGGSRAWIIKVGKTINGTENSTRCWLMRCPCLLLVCEVVTHWFTSRCYHAFNQNCTHILTEGWGTAAGGVTLDRMAWEAGAAATGTEKMPQISEACPDLLSAVYWHANTSGLYVIAGDHSVNYLLISLMVFLSQAIKSQRHVLKVYLYLIIM